MAVHHKFTSVVFFLDEFLGDIAARKQQIMTYHSLGSLVNA